MSECTHMNDNVVAQISPNNGSLLAARAQKKGHPWHLGWKTKPNLGDNSVQKQHGNGQTVTDRHTNQHIYRKTLRTGINMNYYNERK